MPARYHDRRHAGRVLATRLSHYAKRRDVSVFGLPRGGVPVAYEVARSLEAPLDVFIVRKLGMPGEPELAIGAIASGGVLVLSPGLAERVPEPMLADIVAREQRELERREQLFRDNRPPLPIEQRVVIIIDDGLATGASMRAAARALRARKPAQLVAAVPVAPPDVCADIARDVDEMICARTPEWFMSVGDFYEDFEQTTDAEVQELLRRAQPVDRFGRSAGLS